jgi:hypothetical protein
MKLGRDTNSVINYALSGTNGQPTPEVGMGITLLRWTDRDAGTITKVSESGKTFWFRLDRAIRIDDNGMSEMQTYRYEPTTDGPERRARLIKGAWKSAGTRIRLGERLAYRDFSF